MTHTARALWLLFLAAFALALALFVFVAIAGADCAIGWAGCPPDTLTPAWGFLPVVIR